MRITSSQHLPADPERVAEMLADPAFIEYRGTKTDAQVDDTVVTGAPPGEFTVTTRRSITADQIPPQMRSFVGSRLEVRQVEAWEAPVGDARTGNIVFEITGTPVRMTGTARLAARPDGGCELTYDGDLRAAVPLFGSTIEQAAAGAVRATLDQEATAARTWLLEHGSGDGA